MYEVELYHHGIKGQKWGLRRFQNKDGSLKPAGEGRYDDGLSRRQRNKAAKSYNYKDSDSYKNASAADKRKRSNNYAFNKKFYGKKAANKMEYEVDRGADRNKIQKRAAAKKIAKTMAVTALIAASPYIIDYGKKQYAKSYITAQTYSSIAGAYGKAAGLNEVKGGFTTGFKHARAGREFLNRFMNM